MIDKTILLLSVKHSFMTLFIEVVSSFTIAFSFFLVILFAFLPNGRICSIISSLMKLTIIIARQIIFFYYRKTIIANIVFEFRIFTIQEFVKS